MLSSVCHRSVGDIHSVGGGSQGKKSPGQPQKLYSFLANLGKEVRRGDKGKKTRSTSDDAGGKSVIKKSQATRTSQTPFEASKGETEKYFVDSLKDKRTGKKCPEFLIE